MGEFLSQPDFGSDVKGNSSKTSKRYQGQSIYVADENFGLLIRKGNQFYLDGTPNADKTKSGEGRKLPK